MIFDRIYDNMNTNQNVNFEYAYHHFNVLFIFKTSKTQLFAPNVSCVNDVQPFVTYFRMSEEFI